MPKKTTALAQGFSVPDVPEEAAEQFIEAKRAKATSSASQSAPQRQPKGEGSDGDQAPRQKRKYTKRKVPPKLRNETPGERVAIYLPPQLVEDLRIRCVKERRSLSSGVEEALRGWIE